jgi:hypothetical protein
MRNLILLFLSACVGASAMAARLDYVPTDQYSYSIITTLDHLDYQTAVHYQIENKRTGTKLRESSARGTGAQVLAKYDVLIDNLVFDPNLSTPAADIQQLEPIDFTKAENSAQGWARMGVAAVPALTIALNGETSGFASASWRTRYTVQGSGLRNLSLKFRIPEAVMDGRYEFSGKGPHQGRVKVQLLLNGYPVWWSEATRAAPLNPNSANDYVFDNFGATWSFSSSTEKASAKWVTASLGAFSAGQVLDVTLLYFIEASVGRRCEFAADQFACMGMTVSLKRDITSTLPSFISSPPKLSLVPYFP